MGLISGFLGLGSALIGASTANRQAAAQVQAAKIASQQALTGFNYAKDNANFQQAQTAGLQAGSQASALLGLGGNTQQAQDAFNNYLGSTGYQFQMGQGTQAIADQSAASGLLNSGATAKGLQQYGQGLASSYFQNYLGQLQGVQNTGMTAAGNTAALGASGGQAAGSFTQQGASNASQLAIGGTSALMNGLGAAAGGFGSYMRTNNPGMFQSLGGYIGQPGTTDALTGYRVPSVI